MLHAETAPITERKPEGTAAGYHPGYTNPQPNQVPSMFDAGATAAATANEQATRKTGGKATRRTLLNAKVRRGLALMRQVVTAALDSTPDRINATKLVATWPISVRHEFDLALKWIEENEERTDARIRQNNSCQHRPEQVADAPAKTDGERDRPPAEGVARIAGAQ